MRVGAVRVEPLDDVLTPPAPVAGVVGVEKGRTAGTLRAGFGIVSVPSPHALHPHFDSQHRQSPVSAQLQTDRMTGSVGAYGDWPGA
jgi:hypothetical protein